MSKKTLFIGAVASIIAINSVFADTTVTSKQYVDTTRQATIPAAGTNANTPGSTVVTYTGTAGNIGERGIYDGSTTYDSSTDADKLVTASALQNATDNLPTITTSKMTCVDSPDCTLWSVADQTVYGECLKGGEWCGTEAECASLCCDGLDTNCFGENGTMGCQCLLPGSTK